MITAILAVSDGPVSRTVRIRAASLARARRLAGEGREGVSVRLIGPASADIASMQAPHERAAAAATPTAA